MVQRREWDLSAFQSWLLTLEILADCHSMRNPNPNLACGLWKIANPGWGGCPCNAPYPCAGGSWLCQGAVNNLQAFKRTEVMRSNRKPCATCETSASLCVGWVTVLADVPECVKLQETGC